MRSTVLVSISLSLLAAACSGTPDEVSSNYLGTPPGASATASAPSSDAVKSGFVHAFERSKFAVGQGTVQREEFGMQKVVGSQGTFATRKTGLVLALSNADSASRAKAPLTTDGAEHGKAVRAYFVAAGLPEDQIGEVSPYAVMHTEGFGEPSDKDMAHPQLAYYYSVIARQLDGVTVADSFAWARLNADGEAILESAYWPEIPRSVVAEAKRFEAKLAEPAKKTALLAKIGASAAAHEGRLVIHHTPGEWDGAFSATVSYDVDVEDGKTLHLDPNGNALTFEHEKEAAWGRVEETPRLGR